MAKQRKPKRPRIITPHREDNIIEMFIDFSGGKVSAATRLIVDKLGRHQTDGRVSEWRYGHSIPRDVKSVMETIVLPIILEEEIGVDAEHAKRLSEVILRRISAPEKRKATSKPKKTQAVTTKRRKR